MSDYFFEVMGLDKDFNIVCLLKYNNLQWRRKYYEAGTFSIQIPADQYDSSIKYIYTKDRPEVGEITQINYLVSGGEKIFALSGYFLEAELNRRVVYPLGSGNITNAPTWTTQSSNAEDVATAFFDAFKDVDFTYDSTAYTSELGIATATSQSRGNASEHERGGEYLGNKIYTILKPSEMSFRVAYDFTANTKTFECIKGLDRTQDNTDGNNPVIFSTRYGNLQNPNIVVSDTNYKNCYIVNDEYTENDTDYVVNYAKSEATTSDTSDRFVLVDASITKSDYSTTDLYIQALHAQGHEELIDNKTTMSFDFDAVQGSYDYMTDFDLGDKCSLEVKEIGLSVDAVLTECTEVIKKGAWSLSMSFDV